MSKFTLTKRVLAPVGTVFNVATDLDRAAEHIRGIEKIELLTSGEIGVGTKWRETRKVMGRIATETLEITAFDRPQSYTIGCDSCGSHFETTFRFVPDGRATVVTMDVNYEARSLFAKIIAPFTRAMFGKMMRQCMEDDLSDVKQVAESRAAASVTL